MNGSHLARSAFECGENHRFLGVGWLARKQEISTQLGVMRLGESVTYVLELTVAGG
jgi:hypothetical protein